MPILCLDLETTGLDEGESGIIEIGATWLHSGETFHRLCRPRGGTKVEPEALAVNGKTVEQIFAVDVMPEELAIAEFLGWVRGPGETLRSRVQIAAWNAHFDHRHLRAGMKRARIDGRYQPFAHRLIDVHSVLAAEEMSAKVIPVHLPVAEFESFGGEVANADDASRMLGLEPESEPHGALAGARQVRAMLRRLLGDAGAEP